MSVEAKQLLMHDLEKRLSNILTVNNTEEVMKLLYEQLSNYELEKNQSEEPDIESRELLEAYISAKRIEGRSEKTLDRYQYIIRKMMEKLDVPLRKISVFHIRRYLADEKERGLSDRTLEGIREVLSAYFGWLHKEGLIVSNPMEALFIGKGSMRLTPGGVRHMLHKVADRAEVKNTHPHRFRRTLATSLLDHGMPIQEVAVLLGHDKIDTTMTYVYIDKNNVKNSYRKFV